MLVVHLSSSRPKVVSVFMATTACGIGRGLNRLKDFQSSLRITDDPKKVSCQSCLRTKRFREVSGTELGAEED